MSPPRDTGKVGFTQVELSKVPKRLFKDSNPGPIGRYPCALTAEPLHTLNTPPELGASIILLKCVVAVQHDTEHHADDSWSERRALLHSVAHLL